MKHVRGSEVSSFLRCRKQWKYAWVDNIEPKRQDNKLFFGNLAHKFLEVYYSHLNNVLIVDPAAEAYVAMRNYFTETDTSGMQQTEIDELWDLASGVMQNYVKQWSEHDAGITVLATELRFAIPLDDETVYEGTIDLVYLNRDKNLFFKDYKNVQSIERYVGMAEMDRQISRYWWALEQLARGNGYIAHEIDHERFAGDEPTGTFDTEIVWVDVRETQLYDRLQEPSGFVYDLILKDIPTVPSLLKPTTKVPVALSKAKNQKTTYKVYTQTMINVGLMDENLSAPEEYVEILEHLESQESEFGNRFFRRIPVIRNENECQAAMHEFLAVVEDMHNVQTRLKQNAEYVDYGVTPYTDPTYRNINADCSWCNYRALCVAEMDGSNADMIKNLTYKQKEIKQNGELLG